MCVNLYMEQLIYILLIGTDNIEIAPIITRIITLREMHSQILRNTITISSILWSKLNLNCEHINDVVLSTLTTTIESLDRHPLCRH